MTDLWDAEEVRAHLVACARAGQPITYAELLGHLGYAFSRPKMRALCKTLETVDAEARGRGEPELAVLVVRQSDGLPGQGWWVAEKDYKGEWEGPKAQRHIARVQQRAFDYWTKDR